MKLKVQRNDISIKDSFKNPVSAGIYRTQPRSGRGSMGSDYFDCRLPGIDLFPEIMAGDTPIAAGVYLVYYQYIPPLAISSIEKSAPPGTGLWDGKEWQGLRIAGMTIANYQNQRWGLNAKVLAYIGPIPTLSLDMLLDYKPPFPLHQTFFISTIKQAAKGQASSGPHAEYIHAALTPGFLGEYIFKKTNQDSKLIPIARLDPSHQAAIKWKILTDDEKVEITEKFKLLSDCE